MKRSRWSSATISAYQLCRWIGRRSSLLNDIWSETGASSRRRTPHLRTLISLDNRASDSSRSKLWRSKYISVLSPGSKNQTESRARWALASTIRLFCTTHHTTAYWIFADCRNSFTGESTGEFSNKVVIKDPTTPTTRRYTILWQKSSQVGCL